MGKRDYYEVLGLSKGATETEIKKAYRNLAKEHHPDAGGDEAKFKEIAEAYETLSDTKKKEQYDVYGHQTGPNSQQRNPYSGFGDFMNHHFNSFTNLPKIGPNLTLLLKLTLEEIYSGVTKKFKYKRQMSCEPCGGKGGIDATTCSGCNGTGEIIKLIQAGNNHIRFGQPCHICEGSGNVYASNCNTCNGQGVLNAEETVEVEIPHGIHDGMSFGMKGKGHAIKNGTSGDLIINFMVLSHKTFVRNGDDLRVNLKLSYPQLVLGDKVEIETIEGGKIRVAIPEYSKVGDSLRLKDKGLKTFEKETRGVMIVTLDIQIPTSITDEERELIKQLPKVVTI